MIHYFVRPVGATSVILQVFIENSAAAGTGKTGLAFNTSSLSAYYKINSASASVAITLVTCTLGTFTSGGFAEIDSTHQPGLYEIHIPNAAFASGGLVSIVLQGASGMFPCVINVDLGVALTAAERTAAADSLLTRVMTEAYSTTTGTLTLAQALHLIVAGLGNYSVSGTSLTLYGLDGVTPIAVYTLNSSSSPTSRTRTT